MSKEKETKSLEVKKNNEVALASLANEFQGAVQIRSELIKISAIKVGNGLSDGVTGGLCKLGDWHDTVKGVNYGNEVTIVPLFVRESASLMDPKTSKPICSSFDLVKNREGIPCKQCPHDSYWGQWDEDKDGKAVAPKCKLSIDITCLVSIHGAVDSKPSIVSFRKMSYKAGKSLVNLIINDPRRVPFGSKYKTVTEQATNAAGQKYFRPAASIERTALTDEELGEVIPIAKKLMEAKKAGQISEDVDHDDDMPV